MNEAIWIWLYLSLENIVTASLVIAISIFIITGISGIIAKVESAETSADYQMGVRMHHVAKVSAIISLISVALHAFIPSVQEWKFIIGGAAIWNLAQMEEAQQLPSNVLNAANTFLEQIQQQESK